MGSSEKKKFVPENADSAEVAILDTLTEEPVDTLQQLPQDTVAPPDTTRRDALPSPQKKRNVAAVQDTVSRVPHSDTTRTDTAAVSSAPSATPDDSCAQITADLWVYPDPSGGLHDSAVTITLIANRPATIQYRLGENDTWHRYEGVPVPLSTTTTLYYDAIDSCGKVMERREEYYEFTKGTIAAGCDPSMVVVKVGTMHFCIDRYEWPNRKGALPQAYVSYYQAQDSCYTLNKRLCSAEEWAIACSGPYSSKYPYGQRYERYGCTTHDTTVVSSGKKPECRSFFGAYDMSGNIAEWTATKSVENSAFYYVAGGFWESGPKSGCFDKRYSYYPQNQHNPVGFRCCQDISSSPDAHSKGK